jgi:hypothetical protein
MASTSLWVRRLSLVSGVVGGMALGLSALPHEIVAQSSVMPPKLTSGLRSKIRRGHRLTG